MLFIVINGVFAFLFLNLPFYIFFVHSITFRKYFRYLFSQNVNNKKKLGTKREV